MEINSHFSETIRFTVEGTRNFLNPKNICNKSSSQIEDYIKLLKKFSKLDNMKTLGISEHKLAILNNVNGSIMHALKKVILDLEFWGNIL